MKTITKQIILGICICFFLSCQSEKNKTENSCENLRKRVDSLTQIVTAQKSSIYYKFYEILKRENGTNSDSLLIQEYHELIGTNETFDLYIWDRIHSLQIGIHNRKKIKIFTGRYTLKPNHDLKKARITSVEIRNDSCFLYKQNAVVKSQKTNFLKSSNKYTQGMILMDNYMLSLSNATKPILLTLENNLCMDCEPLQYFKVK